MRKHLQSRSDGDRNNGRAISAVGQPTYVKPKRDRKVFWRKVVCPECSAGIGESCLNKEGAAMKSLHRARRRIALREGF